MRIIKDIYTYREFLKTNVKKEMRGRYKKSFLGVLWTFLNPLLQIAVYATVFPIILRDSPDNFLIFLCVALIPWTFFTTSVIQSASSMVANGNIIKKVYFPREIIPISIITSGAVNFLISTAIILVFILFSGLGFTWLIVFYPFVLLVQYVLLLGISFVISSVTVYLRDLEHLIGVALMMMFYMTPIVYSPEAVPDAFRLVLNLNPMTHVITGYRNIFFDQVMPNFTALGILLGLSVILCIVGYFIFNKLQKRFAEEL